MKGVARRDTYQHSYEGGSHVARAFWFVQDSFPFFVTTYSFSEERSGAPLLSPMFSVNGGGGGFSGDISLFSLPTLGGSWVAFIPPWFV